MLSCTVILWLNPLIRHNDDDGGGDDDHSDDEDENNGGASGGACGVYIQTKFGKALKKKKNKIK